MKEQTLAQGEPPDQLVVGQFVPLDHLRPRRQRRVQAIKGIKDHERRFGVACRGDKERIERGRVVGWHVSQHAGVARRNGWVCPAPGSDDRGTQRQCCAATDAGGG
jgi:hypothetical protein